MPRKKHGLSLLWIILLVIAAVFLWRVLDLHSVISGKGRQGKVPGRGRSRDTVTLQAASTEDFPIYLDGLGTVQPYNSALVNARVSGLIQEIRFQEGQNVTKGDVLGGDRSSHIPGAIRSGRCQDSPGYRPTGERQGSSGARQGSARQECARSSDL